MAAVYAAVFRAEGGVGATAVVPRLLVDWSEASRSPRGVDVLGVLAKTPTHFSTQVTQTAQKFLYHILVDTGANGRSFIFVVVAEPSLDKATAFALLDSLKSSLNGRSDWVAVADGAGSSSRGEDKPLQSHMEPMLVKAVGTLNSSEPDKMGALKAQVDQVKSIMSSNVEKVLQRGDRLDDLMNRSEDLEQASSSFRSTSVQVRRAMCWKNAKCNIIIAVSVILGIIILGLVIAWQTGMLGGGSSSSTTTTTPKP